MHLFLTLRKSAVASVLAIVGAVAFTPRHTHASGIPVVDVAAIAQLIADQIGQNLQYAEQAAQTVQMYQDYSLQMQNLAALPGSVREQAETALKVQLINNVADFGSSYLNGAAELNPSSPTYHESVEGMYKVGMNEVPRTMSSVDTDLVAVGMETGTATPMGKSAFVARMHWERIMDDLRQVALTRKNSEERAIIARNMANEMKSLPANNTVGAIQLLAGQQTLSYAQNEDLIKNQAALLKNDQEMQARLLAEREEYRQLEIARLKRARAETYNTSFYFPTH